MRQQERYAGIISWFSQNMPKAETELHYGSPFQLLVAVILSAQCTDKRVNIVTPPLFRDYPTPEALAGASQEAVSTMEELIKLPGVGRKTANVILSVVFNKAAMAVDTHVFRVANRIGLTNNSKTPLETERTLVEHFPKHLLPIAHHWLILHGRYVCTARRPKCQECGISEYCKYYEKTVKPNPLR